MTASLAIDRESGGVDHGQRCMWGEGRDNPSWHRDALNRCQEFVAVPERPMCTPKSVLFEAGPCLLAISPTKPHMPVAAK
jgi:hypothetical protein